MAIYKKKVGYGSYNVNELVATAKDMPLAKGKETGQMWIPARPEPYWSFWERLQQAWDVLTYKADALYWGM